MEEQASRILQEIAQLQSRIEETRLCDTAEQFGDGKLLLAHLDYRLEWFYRIEELRKQLLQLKVQPASKMSYSLSLVHEQETYLERNIQASNSCVLALLDQLFMAVPG